MFDPLAHGAAPVKKPNRFDPLAYGATPVRSSSKPPKKEGDTWGEYLPKRAGQALTELGNLPNLIAKGVESYATRKANENIAANTGGNYNNYEPIAANDMLSKHVPTTTDVRSLIREKTGYDLEPHPSSGSQEFVGHVLDFAAPGGLLGGANKVTKNSNLFNNFIKAGRGALKGTLMGGAVGSTSEVAKEAGVNPLVADIAASAAVPSSLGKVGKTLIGAKNIVLPSNAKTQEKIRKFYSNYIGEDNIPSVIKSLEEPSSLVKPTAAEKSGSHAFASLQKTTASESPKFAETLANKRTSENAILENKIKGLGNVDYSKQTGAEGTKQHIFENLKQHYKKRKEVSEPLYEKFNNLEEGVSLDPLMQVVKKEGKNSHGKIKTALNKIQKDISLNKNATKEADSLKNHFSYKEYKKLVNPSAYPSELSATPAKIKEIAKTYRGEANSISRADRNQPLARVHKEVAEAAENLIRDVPERQIADRTYHELSEGVDNIKHDKTLKEIVARKDRRFKNSSEDIHKNIRTMNVGSTENLMKQIKGNKSHVNYVRGVMAEDMLNKSTSANSELSPAAFTKYLNNNKEKLSHVYEADQLNLLKDVQKALSGRHFVATSGTGGNRSGLSLASLFLDQNKTYKKLPFSVQKIVRLMDFNSNYKFEKMKSLIEESLINPEVAKTLLMPVNKITNPNSILERLLPIVSNVSSRQQKEEK